MRALKAAGLIPALAAIIVQLVSADFLEKLDLLRGYGGTSSQLIALALCALAWFAASRAYAKWPAISSWVRPISTLTALLLFIVTLFLVLWPLSESQTDLADMRWRTALFTYLAFYLSLGIAFA